MKNNQTLEMIFGKKKIDTKSQAAFIAMLSQINQTETKKENNERKLHHGADSGAV